MHERLLRKKIEKGRVSDMDILIRPESSLDFTRVYEVVQSAFSRAPHTNHDEQNLVVRLRKSMAFIPGLSLVAVVNDQIVGHILFTKIKIKNHNAEYTSLALAPLSVLPEVQGKGIGGKLILAGHQTALELGFSSVILVGHPEYYPRFGYIPASCFGITAPFDISNEVFMACQLTPHALAGVKGIVEFPGEFFN